MTYTMRDVNKLIMARGWPRLMAMEYYIELCLFTSDNASNTLVENYNRERYYES